MASKKIYPYNQLVVTLCGNYYAKTFNEKNRQVFTDTIDVIMLEITISSEMEKEKNGHDFTIR